MRTCKHCSPAEILRERCPNCGKGQVFEKGKWWQMPEMHDQCGECSYRFNREPGYFLGAMYISYGIAVLAGLLTFLFLHFFFPAIPLIYVPISIVCVILAIARKNYKLSRIIYICLFPW